MKYSAITLLVTLNFTLNFDNIKNSYLFYHNKYHSENIQTAFKVQNELQKLVGDPSQKLTLLIDYRAPVIYSSFRDNVNTVFVFDNIAVVEKWLKPEFDYILLHNDSKMMINEKDFKRYLLTDADQNYKNIWTESRRVIKTLVDTGKFREVNYKIIYNKNQLVFLKRI